MRAGRGAGLGIRIHAQSFRGARPGRLTHSFQDHAGARLTTPAVKFDKRPQQSLRLGLLKILQSEAQGDTLQIIGCKPRPKSVEIEVAGLRHGVYEIQLAMTIGLPATSASNARKTEAVALRIGQRNERFRQRSNRRRSLIVPLALHDSAGRHVDLQQREHKQQVHGVIR
jgi:hypothetical protein